MTSNNIGLSRSFRQGLMTKVLAFAVIPSAYCSPGKEEIFMGTLDRQFR